jgi:DNA-binding IclR family transcriptional regulator
MELGNNNQKSLTTIETAFDIIELIMESNGARVSQIATSLDLHKSTVHNYLGTLQQQGYLVKKGEEYCIGLPFLTVGGHAAASRPGYQLLRTKVNQLATDTGERAQCIVEQNGIGFYIYDMSGGNAVQTDVRIGKQALLHTTSAGKAILAYLPDEEVRQIIDYWGLPKRTEHTITDEEELLEELHEIREQKYAFNDEERIIGQRAVGVPILDENRDIITGLSVSGPKNRLKGEWFESEIPDILLGIANEIELNLQFS